MGLGLFLIALLRRKEGLKRTCLAIFFIVANVAIATYVTGNAAESVLRGTDSDPAFPAGVSPGAIRGHEDAALLAFVFMEITGFFAWLALWQGRRVPRMPRWNVGVVLLLATLTFSLIARAAELGGEIHHSEISAPSTITTAAADGADDGTVRAIGRFVDGSSGQPWVWAACETLHFVGLCMLFSVVIIVNLRMLGMIRNVSFAAVYQLLPIGMLGFGLNLITGMLFFIATPGQYVNNVAFFWKIAFVVLGGLNILYFILDDEPWTVGEGDDAPVTAKLAAAWSIFLWAAVLFCGHMLPFIGNSF
jgi:hypothetical protein